MTLLTSFLVNSLLDIIGLPTTLVQNSFNWSLVKPCLLASTRIKPNCLGFAYGDAPSLSNGCSTSLRNGTTSASRVGCRDCAACISSRDAIDLLAPMPIMAIARPMALVYPTSFSLDLVNELLPGYTSHADAITGIGSSAVRQIVTTQRIKQA